MKTDINSYHECAITIFDIASYDMDTCFTPSDTIIYVAVNRDDNTLISSLADVACIGVARNNKSNTFIIDVICVVNIITIHTIGVASTYQRWIERGPE